MPLEPFGMDWFLLVFLYWLFSAVNEHSLINMKYTALPLLIILYCNVSHAQNIGHKIFAPDANSADYFGYSVSLNGDFAIIGANGAYNDVSDDNEAGVGYIYKRENSEWSFHQKIAEPEIVTYNNFGFDVDIDETHALIGAPKTSNGGSVFIYKRDGEHWERQLKLPEYYNSDFGSAVSISGDNIVVGAPDNKGLGSSSSHQGAAWLYSKSIDGETESWDEVTQITASDGYDYGHFGQDVDISGNCVIVGAWTESVDYYGRSAAYIFEKENGNWVEKQRLFPMDTDTTTNHFGKSVSIFGETAAVGAPEEINEHEVTGAVYIFEKRSDSWHQTAKLISPDTSRYGYFGRSLDIQDQRILVGAYNAVFLYEMKEQNWQLTDSIHNDYYNGGVAYQSFGKSITLSDSAFLVGASDDCDMASWAGAAHFYNISFDPPTNVSIESSPDAFIAFPNPVKTILNLKNIQGAKQINIYSSTGVRLRTIDIPRADTFIKEVDLSDYVNGLFLISVVYDGGDYQTIKVIKN